MLERRFSDGWTERFSTPHNITLLENPGFSINKMHETFINNQKRKIYYAK